MHLTTTPSIAYTHAFRADAEMSEVYLDRSCVDFGLAAADRVETVTVNNNTNTEVILTISSPFPVDPVATIGEGR